MKNTGRPGYIEFKEKWFHKKVSNIIKQMS